MLHATQLADILISQEPLTSFRALLEEQFINPSGALYQWNFCPLACYLPVTRDAELEL
jgi:hypothetical protein